MDVLDSLRDKIRKEMNELADIAATGGVADWPAYQRLVGRVDGLAVAESYLLDLKKKLDEQ